MDEITLTIQAPEAVLDAMTANVGIPTSPAHWHLTEDGTVTVLGCDRESWKRLLAIEGNVGHVVGWALAMGHQYPDALYLVDFASFERQEAGIVQVQGRRVIAEHVGPFMVRVLERCLTTDAGEVRTLMVDAQVCETIEALDRIAKESPAKVPTLIAMLEAWLSSDCEWHADEVASMRKHMEEVDASRAKTAR